MSESAWRTLEDAALAAWPAAVQYHYRGFVLRQTHGVTSRANSVWTPGWAGATAPNAADIDEIERLYTRAGLPSQFQLLSWGQPAGFTTLLSERGYHASRATDVMTAPLAPATIADERIQCASRASGRWLALHATLNGCDAATLAVRAAIMRRIVVETAFLTVLDEADEPAGVALITHHDRVAGLCNMGILPAARRQGRARRLLAYGAAWAQSRGAETLFLQVQGQQRSGPKAIRRGRFHQTVQLQLLHPSAYPKIKISATPTIATTVPTTLRIEIGLRSMRLQAESKRRAAGQ